MSDPVRKRIDVLPDLHRRLEIEAGRKGIKLGQMIDRILSESLERSGNADVSPGKLEQTKRVAETGSLTTQLADMIARFDALVERLVTELPEAIAGGFAAVTKTIGNTGGTGHLRTMLADQDKAQTARLAAMKTGEETGRNAQTLLLENGNRELARQIDVLKNEVVVLRAWHKGRRWAFAGGVLSTLAGLMALAFVLAGTQPTRWLAIRLVGETTTVGAAYALAGDDRATGKLMAQTKALLDDQQFRSDYTRCTTRTREVKRRFSCRISMPPYVPGKL